MRKLIPVIIVILIMASGTKAQDYNTGIGFRGGLSYGLTVKHFLNENGAIEGILFSRWRGFILTGLYEIHNPAFGVDGLNWYFGGGAHIGSWRGYKDHPWFKDNATYTVIGVDGIIGLEYNFSEVPINIGVDWKPGFNLIGYSGFWSDDAALSVRYIF